MKVIVGLGNPGIEYLSTRHNVGFMFLDYLSKFYNFSWINKSRFQAETAEASIKDSKLFFIKPTTYMNLSGEAVRSISSYYKIQNKDLIIVRDDKDLPFAKFKMKFNSGSGGHNGIKSINNLLGADYYQLKIGIGCPDTENLNLEIKKEIISRYVLDKFSSHELISLQYLFEKIRNDFIKALINDKMDEFVLE